MRLALGLDCGGSSSRALALNEAGKTVFEGRGGPANLASTPQQELAVNVAKCLEGCPPVSAIAGCFAGLLTSADRVRALDLLRSILHAPCMDAYADYEAALAAGGDEINGVVIAGTGAIICSHAASGTRKTGGGGPLLGDEGSLCFIGRRALWHTLISARGLPLGPALQEHLQAEFQSDDANDVASALYRHLTPAQRIAQIGAAAIRDAEHKAEYAVLAVKEGLRALAEECHLHFAGYGTVNLGLTGGLWKISPALSTEFEDVLNQTNAAPYSVSIIEREPVEGAARLAQKLLT